MSSQPPRPPDWWQPDAGGSSGSGAPRQPAQGQQPYPQQPYPQQPDRFGDPQQPDRLEHPQQWADATRPPERGRGGRRVAAVAGLVAVAVVGSVGGYWLGHRGSGSTATTSAPVVTTNPATSAGS